MWTKDGAAGLDDVAAFAIGPAVGSLAGRVSASSPRMKFVTPCSADFHIAIAEVVDGEAAMRVGQAGEGG